MSRTHLTCALQNMALDWNILVCGWAGTVARGSLNLKVSAFSGETPVSAGA